MGGLRGIFGSEILAKRDFLGSMKDARIFGIAKMHRDFVGYCNFYQLKSTII